METKTAIMRHARRGLTIAAGLALVALPATAAMQSDGGGSSAAPVGATVAETTAAPAVTATADGAGGTADAVAQVVSDGAAVLGDGQVGAEDASANTAAVPSDETGSTEAVTIQRSCGAEADPHYDPPSGAGQSECLDGNGDFDPSRTYTATHFTNDVQCGSENVLVPVDAAGVYVSGNGGAGADGGDGYLSTCSDDALPINGRATARGEGDTSGDLAVSATADGDKDNPESTSQGWVTATVTPGGPEYRCGKSYADGGRADSDAPTAEDTAEECG